MKRFNILRLFLAAWLFVIIGVQPLRAQVQTPRYISMSPNTNGFYEYLPQGYDPLGTQTYPLLVFCHGSGEAGNGSPSQLPLVLRNGPPKLINAGTFPTSFTVNGQTYRFIVISPQFVGWPTPSDINSIINYATQNYRVNISKVYLTGLSMGGGVTWDYPGTSVVFANRLAGLVPVAGASSPENSRARNIATSNLPVWATHNNGDPTVPVAYTNGYIDLINAAPAPNPLARKTIFTSNSHDAWTTTYDPNYRENNMNVYEWMLQYQRNYNGVNQPPIADAGPDQILSLSSNFTQLMGSNSWDLEGPIVTYNWQKISGPAQYTLSSTSIANPSLTNLVAGSYTFRLSVTDNQGAVSTDDINVSVVPVQQIPGRVEAENYFNIYGVVIDTAIDVGAGNILAYIDNGDWMDYNVNVATAGTYTVGFRVASINNGQQLQLRKSDGTILATVNIPNTGGWQTWQTVSTNVVLPAGNQILRVFSVTSGWNFNWMNFSSIGGTNQPPVARAGADQTITAPVSSVTLDGSGSTDDHNIVSYLWTKLPASTGAGGTLTTPNASTTTFTGLSAGTYQVELKVTDDSSAISRDTVLITVNPASGGKQIPGLIEAESYDNMSGVGIYPTTDVGAGNCVGSIDNGDWMDYNVTVAATGTYTVAFRVATINNGAQFQVKKGTSTLLTVPVPNTGGWQTWATVTMSLPLTAGSQTLRIFSTGNGWNFNWMNYSSSSGNQPPVANAGANQTILFPASSVSLSGSGSDPDGTIASYAWTNISGPNTPIISSPLTASTPVTGLIPGVYIIRLTVTDNGGATATSDITITVSAPNQPPVARAGADQIITLPANSVALNGIASSDDHNIVSYQWTKLAGSTGAGGSFGTPTASTTTFTGLSAGIYQVELKVTDDSSAIGRDTVQITVNAALPTGKTIPGHIEAETYDNMSGVGIYPTTDLGAGNCVGSIDNGDWMDYNVTVTASGTYAANFRVASINNGVQFQVRNGSAILATVAVPNTGGWQTWSTVSVNISLQAGAQTLRIYSTGNGWNFNWVDFLSSVTNPNQPPIAQAGADQTITLPTSSVNLNGSASTDDHNIVSYQWTKLLTSTGAGGSFGTPTASTTTFTGLSAGVYFVELKVTDDSSAVSRDTVQITVNSALNQPPVARAGADQIITLPANSVTLNGTASSDDHNIVSYQWTKLPGSTGAGGSFGTPAASTTTFTGLSAGVYQVELKVTDDSSAVGRDTVQITVNAASSNGQPIPGHIEAESYNSMSGVGIYPATDVGGGNCVGSIDNGDWMDYNVSVSTTGTYSVNFRVASINNGAQFQVRNGSTIIATIPVPNTGGWQTWTTITVNLFLTAGDQTLRIYSFGNGWNFNWADFSFTGSFTRIVSNPGVDKTIPENTNAGPEFKIFPNPATDQFTLQLNNDYAGAFMVRVIDQNGALKKQMQFTKNKGSFQVSIPTIGLSAGEYIIRMEAATWSKSLKLLKL